MREGELTLKSGGGGRHDAQASQCGGCQAGAPSSDAAPNAQMVPGHSADKTNPPTRPPSLIKRCVCCLALLPLTGRLIIASCTKARTIVVGQTLGSKTTRELDLATLDVLSLQIPSLQLLHRNFSTLSFPARTTFCLSRHRPSLIFPTARYPSLSI
ncbi:hypothetical protein BDW02DRAFT_396785 [Decorospora gaudefroyi]|uniref:Uncharacterized protein n=1 Tax=Decorospora gaudefroyi TaxID=184978 RepID=A0A6A5K5S5_9PLEO|nr:hypothetical protein BDW02DRAFT_396785 [Decorospora gaudefroyi]